MFNLTPQLYKISLTSDSRLRKIIKDAKEKVAKYFRIPEYLLNSKCKIARLPEIYRIEIRFGNYIIRKTRRVGKVFGMFKPYANEILIDPENFYSEEHLRKTIIHEFIHKAQAILGKVSTFSRYSIEKEAYSLTEKLA